MPNYMVCSHESSPSDTPEVLIVLAHGPSVGQNDEKWATSTRVGVTWADVRRLNVVSWSLSHRSVIFFRTAGHCAPSDRGRGPGSAQPLTSAPPQPFDASDHTVWPMGVVNVVARPSGAAPPWFHVVDDGKVGVGPLSCAHPNLDDDFLHCPGMVKGRDISDCLVVERRGDKTAVKSGGDRRPGGRADFRRGRLTARRAGGNQDAGAEQAGNHGCDSSHGQSPSDECELQLGLQLREHPRPAAHGQLATLSA
jgi:hypothetical protein